LWDCAPELPFPNLFADSFFGKPELQEQMVERNVPTRCAAGVLALRVPDPPSYAPPSVCAISKDGKIAAVGGKDVELYLWSTDSGDLLSTLRGHEIAWTSSNDNTFFVTVQEDSKVLGKSRRHADLQGEKISSQLRCSTNHQGYNPNH
jgi:WD40 repeat protein